MAEYEMQAKRALLETVRVLSFHEYFHIKNIDPKKIGMILFLFMRSSIGQKFRQNINKCDICNR